ncbi:MAG: hypothetical protein ABSG78_11800 [Verrucomicrobiota bacterium]
MKLKMEWFVGRWQAREEQIGVLFVIAKTANGFRIQAFDQSDGEELVVSKVK